MIALLALAVGVFCGLLAGGNLAAVGSFRLRFEVAILVAFVLQGAARGRLLISPAFSWGLVVWAVASAALAGLLLFNSRHAGAPVATAGTLLNLVVVLANSGMPIKPGLGEASAAASAAVGSAGFYHIAGSWTLVTWLGDVMPLELFGQRLYVSVGDLLLLVGVAVMLASSMLVRPQSS